MATSSRPANLLGALALAVTDRLTQVTDAAAGHGAMVPAALVTLHHSPGIRIGELARILGLTHPGTVRLVDRLEADGLVERRTASDARAVALALAPRGQRAARRVLDERADVLDDALAALAPDEAAQFEALVGRLLRALTPDPDLADHTCRLCDERVCPVVTCPVEQAIADQR